MSERKSVRDRIAFYFTCFFLYSVLGWIYEVFLEVVVYRWGFSDRGVLFGPYCPVYGFGALAFILCLAKVKSLRLRLGRIPVTPVLSFLGIVLIATLLELAASYLLQWTTGGWPWDYRRNWLNFDGRIAFSPSLRFGIGGMFVLYLIQPFFGRIAVRLGDRQVNTIGAVLGIIFSIDLAATIICKIAANHPG
jgi:uncharacterized membrane protein